MFSSIFLNMPELWFWHNFLFIKTNMETHTTKPVILYAEDDEDDFDSIKDALNQITHDFTLLHARHGQEVIKLLEEDKVHPSMIVLDLNMPIMDGKETLQWLKSNDNYKSLPVMIFTTSSREDDIKLCQTHKCSFFRKPTLYRDLLHVAQVMLQMSNEKVS
jgi:CheY-like chemotaxis protein